MQYTTAFIDHHFMPFLRKIMMDVAKNEAEAKASGAVSATATVSGDSGPKKALNALFEKSEGNLDPQEREQFMMAYFIGKENDSVTPFTKPSEIKEREAFLKYLHDFVKRLGTTPDQRKSMLVPLYDAEKKTFDWTSTKSQNLYRMAYRLANHFEKDLIAEKIKESNLTDEQKRKHHQLNALGLLVAKKSSKSVKYEYINKNQIKPGEKIRPLVAPPSIQAKKIISGGGSFGLMTEDEIVAEIGQKGTSKIEALPEEEIEVEIVMEDHDQQASHEMKNSLEAAGIAIAGEITFVEGEGYATIDAIDPINLKIVAGVEDEEVQFVFSFEKDPSQKFTLTESQLRKYFKNPNGTSRSAAEVYAILSQREDFDPEQPPTVEVELERLNANTSAADQSLQKEKSQLENLADSGSLSTASTANPTAKAQDSAPSSLSGNVDESARPSSSVFMIPQGSRAPMPFRASAQLPGKTFVKPQKLGGVTPFDLQKAKAATEKRREASPENQKKSQNKNADEVKAESVNEPPQRPQPAFLKQNQPQKKSFFQKHGKALFIGGSIAAGVTTPILGSIFSIFKT